jgi:hypothetical protein
LQLEFVGPSLHPLVHTESCPLDRELLQWLDWEADEQRASQDNMKSVNRAQLLVRRCSWFHQLGRCTQLLLLVSTELCNAMQVRIAEAGLFCPASYLRCLVARGTFVRQPGSTIGADAKGSFHRYNLCFECGPCPWFRSPVTQF